MQQGYMADSSYGWMRTEDLEPQHRDIVRTVVARIAGDCTQEMALQLTAESRGMDNHRPALMLGVRSSLRRTSV